MPCRRSPDYKSSSSRTWIGEERGEGELAEFALPLLGTSVSCAPHLFSHWCGTGRCLLGGWGGRSWGVWVRSVCACRCERFKGPSLIFWPQLPEKGPLRLGSGACAIFQTLPVFIFYFFFSLFLSPLSLTLSFLPRSTRLWDIDS